MRAAVLALVALLLTLSASAQRSTEVEAVESVVAEWWAWRLADDPLFASYVGVRDHDDRLQDVTAEARAARAAQAARFLDRLDAIDADALEGEARITAGILRTMLDDVIDADRFGAELMPVTASDGFHVAFTRLPSQMPMTTVAEVENYLARLRAWPAHVEAQIANMREGLRTGRTLPAVAIQGLPATIAAHVVADPEASVFWAPLAELPSTLPEADRARLMEEGRAVIETAVVPGYAAFLAFMEGEYLPGARATIGLGDLPGGEAAYAWRVRQFTTLDVTPRAVHDIGLAEVDRIRGEMEAVIAEVGFEGSFDDFLTFLRTDPQFVADSPEALLREGAWIAMQMNAKLPQLFGRLPRLPYTVQPVPDFLAPTFTAGFYVEPPAGGRVPGVYWLNTYDLPSRPTWALEALTFHEAVPGHHLQIALAQELDHLPAFRRALVLTAYEEGWGLYAESLGTEAGFYTDPYRRFGRLTYEMWRACRLVVDTGMHALGWSRQDAIDYLGANTALSELEVRTEVDRYIGWPGQALGYKMGELTIRRLRTEAEDALGERFDVRAFHDEVLGHGELPMGVLETVVRDWIARQ
ncbi:hypothetical protein B1759_03320 [Rubrivirga sp. SAORIC476]|uniref:DUF885 domain-containing protein n=1 Tax=Rubrivirga sp. SAORIC476 TaxID=1961794 RepID=UPI000BA91461|nr:DUF885 domain-containing protein [Rubrivirga sp. SAORIC476]PAP80434.1 hypothetical protein B1759_03320 [Rubrivirga sp. SAORIC476]